MRHITRLVIACATLLAASYIGAGCAGSSSGGIGSSGPVAQSEFPRQFSEAVCQSMTACCRENGYNHDYATCQRSLEGQYAAAIFAYEGMNVRFDAGAAGRCLDAYVAGFQACEPIEDSACEDVFVGTVAPGGTCTESAECTEPTGVRVYCESGVCTEDSSLSPDVVAREGEACGGTCTREGSGYSCSGFGEASVASCLTNDGLHCDRITETCLPLPELGAACPAYECAEGAFCDAGTCVATRASGPCPTSAACTATAYCDFETRECLPRKQDGSSCTSEDECLVSSCQDGSCRKRVPASTGTCAGLID